MAEQTQTPSRAAQRAVNQIVPMLPASAVDDLRKHQWQRAIERATGLPDVEQALAVITDHAEKGLDGVGEPEARLRAILAQSRTAQAQLRGEQGESDE